MTRKEILPIAIFIASALLIWFVGPLMTIANHAPLTQAVQRGYVITALFLILFLKYLFLDTANKKVPQATSPLQQEINKRIELLQNRFQGAIEFLKKTALNRNNTTIHLAELPWYLLIGPPSAGKTTLLANSKINFILAKQFKSEQIAQIPSSDSCDWWVTRDSVLVDVPGAYLMSPNNSAKKSDGVIANATWRGLLNLIKNSPTREKLNGVIVSINLPELMKKQNDQRNQIIHDLKRRIVDLRTMFGIELPFYFVITKCDSLPGFLEFFSENTQDELGQAWGITLPVLQPHEKLVDVFSHRFNTLIKRLNKQLLWRLHHEHNPFARAYIKDFPLHVERLKETLTNFLNALAMPDLHLHGVYLTSAIQKNIEETQTYLYPATHPQNSQIMRAPAIPARPYFIKQMLMQGILQTFEYPGQEKKVTLLQQRLTYAAALSVVVIAALLLGRDFQHSVQKAYAMQNELSHFQLYMQQSTNDTGRLVKALPLLDSLQQAASAAKQKNSILSALAFYSHQSQRTANVVYNQALQTIVLPEVKKNLEKYLQTANSKNPEYVYTALKAYLMLADEQNRQASFITNTLNLIISQPMNKNALSQLTQHIDAAFHDNSLTIDLKSDLIAEVRKQLVNLPSDDLSMLILKNYDNNNADSAVELGTNTGHPPVFVSHNLANRIPNIFTADYFAKVVDGQIAMAANEAINGNWVLGDISSNPNQPTTATLTTQLHNRYLANYIDIWESLLANIQPNTPKNLLQTDEMIVSLTNNNSPLLHLLQTIKKNTDFAPITTSSPKLQALNNLIGSVGDDRESPLYQVFVNLRQLHSYLQTILTANDLSKAAFDISTQRMKNSAHDPITEVRRLADQSPEPMKTWLRTISGDSWGFIMSEAAQYIGVAWQNQILPTYNTDILNHYPFNQRSRQEVNLVHFTQFLGHQGKLAVFYTSYFKPFIDDSHLPWTWRNIDDQKIPFSNALLANLEHAALLQRVFFPYKDNKLAVQFALRPVALEAGVKSFELNINGSAVYLQKNNVRGIRVLSWPGNFTRHGTSVNVITANNKMIRNSYEGDWAWFKLVNNALQNINGKKELLLTFSANGRTAKYLLSANSELNPFLANNLASFELPQELIPVG